MIKGVIFDFQRQKGVSRMESLEVVLNKGSHIYSDAEKLVLAERKNSYYIDLLQKLTPEAVLPQMVETLCMLRERGILIGVGSVSKNTPLILAKTQLSDYIDQV